MRPISRRPQSVCRFVPACAALAALALPSSTLLAQPTIFTWTGRGDFPLWNDPENWDAADANAAPENLQPSPSDDFIFPDISGSLQQTSINNFGTYVFEDDSNADFLNGDQNNDGFINDIPTLHFAGGSNANSTAYTLDGNPILLRTASLGLIAPQAPGAPGLFVEAGAYDIVLEEPNAIVFDGTRADITHRVNLTVGIQGESRFATAGNTVIFQNVAIENAENVFNTDALEDDIFGNLTVQSDGIIVFGGIVSGAGQVTMPDTHAGEVVFGDPFVGPEVTQAANTFGDSADPDSDGDPVNGLLLQGGTAVLAKSGAVGTETLRIVGGTLAAGNSAGADVVIEAPVELFNTYNGQNHDLVLQGVSQELFDRGVRDVSLTLAGDVNFGINTGEVRLIDVGTSLETDAQGNPLPLELIIQGQLLAEQPGTSDPVNRAVLTVKKVGDGRLVMRADNDLRDPIDQNDPNAPAYIGHFIHAEGTLVFSASDDPTGYDGDLTFGDPDVAEGARETVNIEAITGENNDPTIEVLHDVINVLTDVHYVGEAGDNFYNRLELSPDYFDFGGQTRNFEVDEDLSLIFGFGGAFSNIVNATGLTKTGEGILVVNGDSSIDEAGPDGLFNTADDLPAFNGDVEVRGGLLLLGNENALGDATDPTVIDNTITLANGGGVGTFLSEPSSLDRIWVFEGDFRIGGVDDFTLLQSQGGGTLDLTTNRLAAGIPAIQVDVDRTAIFGAPVVSDMGLIKNGGGTLEFSENSPNFTGDVFIQNGRVHVNIAAPDATGAIANDALVSIVLPPFFSGPPALPSSLEISSDETIGQFSGNGFLLVNAGATLATRGVRAAEFSGGLSGAGNLDIGNTAHTVLSGINTGFTGNLILTDGRLVVRGNQALGSAGQLIANGGELEARDATITSDMGVTFADDLSVTGNRDIRFNGPVNFNDNADAGFDIDVDSGVVFTLAGDFATIDANEAFTKRGGGTLRLLGDASEFDDDLTVAAGTLDLRGRIDGDLVVNNGGRLTGQGRIEGNIADKASLTINDGGTFEPGLGNFTIEDGNFRLANGANYVVDVTRNGNAIRGTRLNVIDGNATFTRGGGIQLRTRGGENSLRAGDSVVIAAVSGGTLASTLNQSDVSGDNSFLLDFRLARRGNQLVITAQLDDQAVVDAGGNANESASARALAELLTSGAVPDEQLELVDALLSVASAAELNEVAKRNQPSPHNETLVALGQSQNAFVGTLSNYLANRRSNIPTLATLNQRVQGDAPADLSLASLGTSPELLNAVIQSQRSSRDYYRYVGVEDPVTPWTAFARGYTVLSETDGDGGATRVGSDAFTIGGQVGMDYTFEDIDLIVGGTFGFAYTDTDFEAGFGDSTASSIRAGAYATWFHDDLWVDGSLSFGYHFIDSTRTTVFPGLSGEATADYTAFDLTAAANVGYDFKIRDIPGLVLTPSGGVIVTNYNQEEFTEDGLGAMTVDEINETYLDIIAAFTGSYVYTNQVNQHTYVTELGGGLKFRATGDETDVTARYAGTDVAFTTTTETSEDIIPFVQAGFTWLWNKRNSVYVRYTGEFPEDRLTHVAEFGYVVKF